MEIIEGFKRFSKIYIDKNNFGYRVNKKKLDGKLFLRCYEDTCPGSGVYLSEEDKFKAKTKHNHKADTLLILKWKFLQTIKHRAECETTNLATIYQEECDNYPEVDHPPYSRLQSTLLKRRKAKKSSESLLMEDSKEHVSLLPYIEPSSEEMENDRIYQETGDMQLNEALKAIPQMFSEFVTEYPTAGKIVDVVEGPKRFSRVFIDDVGYPYQQNKKRRDGTLLLKCHMDGCSGTGIFNSDTMGFIRLASHFHNPNPHSVLKLRFLHSVKLRAEKESTTLSTIYVEEASRFQGTPLPSFDKIKSTLRKRRLANLSQNSDLSSSESSLARGCDFREKLAVATHFIGRKGMEVMEGPKRFSKIYIDDHSYCYLINRKKADGSLILRCHEDGCRGSGRFDPSESLFHKMAKHSHYADPLLVTKWRFLHQCKKRAENETTPIKTIYDQEYVRHPNCNLPSFKKIESTLQKRRKSKHLKEDGLTAQMDAIGIPGSPGTYELEVQMEEVYHPEGNPSYFISPNISYESPVAVLDKKDFPTPIIVRTGKGEYLHQENEYHVGYPSHSSTDKTSPKQTKLAKKKGRKRKDDAVKMKNEFYVKRIKLRKPRLASNYTSKMDVMEGTKRFSKIFIDEAQHIYQLNKARLDGVLILKCYENECPGSGLYFPAEEIFQRSAEHIHEPSPNLVAKCRLLSSLKFRAESESTSLRLIYEEEVVKYPGIEIPSFRQMESTLQKRRRAKIPSEPSSLSEAALQFQRTDFSKCDRGNFFRCYLSDYEDEMLVFVSPGALEEKLRMSRTFYIDSSFRVVPQGFAQVVIVCIVVENHVFPVVYALMSTRSSISYVKLFDFLKKEYEDLDPHFVATDYVHDLEMAFRTVFPTALIKGCWFHYTQAIWRQIRTCGLAQIYFQDEEAKMILRCAMALPLLPSDRIADGIAFLQDAIANSDFHLAETKNSLFKIINFIEGHWLQRIGPDKFSVFGLERKLNYDIDFLYRFFVKKVGVESPTLIKFVEKMFQAEHVILGEYNQILTGKTIRADRSRKCNENEKMLKEISARFGAGQMFVDVFLTTASSAVPEHCHHDYPVHNPDEMTVFQDPSDIPVSLPYCEINVVAPHDDVMEERELKPLVHANIELFQGTDGNLIIENVGVSNQNLEAPNHFQNLEARKSHPERGKEFSNMIVWTSAFPSTQTHQFADSQELLHITDSSNVMKEEDRNIREGITPSTGSQILQQKEISNSDGVNISSVHGISDCVNISPKQNIISDSANISQNRDMKNHERDAHYSHQKSDNTSQVTLVPERKSKVPVYNKSDAPVYLLYSDSGKS